MNEKMHEQVNEIDREEILRLTHRLWINEATLEEVSRLEALLLASKAARDIYRSSLSMDLSLMRENGVKTKLPLLRGEDEDETIKRNLVQDDKGHSGASQGASQSTSQLTSQVTSQGADGSQLKIWGSRLMMVGSIAAAILLLVNLFYQPAIDETGNARALGTLKPVVAQVMRTSGAVWGVHAPEAGNMTAGVWQLDQGVVNLAFQNASVTLEGPARYEILSGQESRLHEGRISIRKHAGAIDGDFQVVTPILGTQPLAINQKQDGAPMRPAAYGLNVDKTGETEIHVFSGEVKIETRQVEGEVQGKAILREGEALSTKITKPAQLRDLRSTEPREDPGYTTSLDEKGRFKVNGEYWIPKFWHKEDQKRRRKLLAMRFKDIPYNAKAFTNAWMLENGVARIAGATRIVLPGPPWDLTQEIDSDFVVLFPERKDVVLQEDLPVDTVHIEAVFHEHQFEGNTLPKGTKITSFLLQYNPAKTHLAKTHLAKTHVTNSHAAKINPDESLQDFKIDGASKRLNGMVGFDKPILAMIWSSEKLAASDSVLGRSDTNYGTSERRGINAPKLDATFKPWHDRITLWGLRNGMSYSLNCGNDMDQIRILVASE